MTRRQSRFKYYDNTSVIRGFSFFFFYFFYLHFERAGHHLITNLKSSDLISYLIVALLYLYLYLKIYCRHVNDLVKLKRSLIGQVKILKKKDKKNFSKELDFFYSFVLLYSVHSISVISNFLFVFFFLLP